MYLRHFKSNGHPRRVVAWAEPAKLDNFSKIACFLPEGAEAFGKIGSVCLDMGSRKSVLDIYARQTGVSRAPRKSRVKPRSPRRKDLQLRDQNNKTSITPSPGGKAF